MNVAGNWELEWGSPKAFPTRARKKATILISSTYKRQTNRAGVSLSSGMADRFSSLWRYGIASAIVLPALAATLVAVNERIAPATIQTDVAVLTVAVVLSAVWLSKRSTKTAWFTWLCFVPGMLIIGVLFGFWFVGYVYGLSL